MDSFSILINTFGFKLDYLHLKIILPVGISFYTFQTLSYTIDIYRGKLKPTNNFINFAVFVSFFPQLVAGPIERAKKLLPQIELERKTSLIQIKDGIALIIFGLFKKVLIGDTTGRIVDHLFAQPNLYTSMELLSGLVLFSIQIYADFSGYSSIARGTAKLLGFELMENFEQPYLSRNITEFWRRWHISLSSWLKDYLYISLGGNRNGVKRTYLNLLITMVLGGLWHGASWNFVIWGLLHGLYLAVHKIILNRKVLKNTDSFTFKIKSGLNILLNYNLVLITWLFFRAKDFKTTVIFFDKMLNWEMGELATRFIVIVLSFGVMTLVLDILERKFKDIEGLIYVFPKPIAYGVLLGIFATTILFMFQSEPLPFVYFQF